MTTAPTVGRIVHYYPGNHEDDEQAFYAAIVTGAAVVSGNSCLRLTVFPPDGAPQTRTVLTAENLKNEMGRHWAWPQRVSEGR